MADAQRFSEPIFLTLDDVLRIHDHQIAEYGGKDGILDINQVESAIAQPCQTFGGAFLHPDVPSMAAAYFYYLAAGHGFEDGNKRTGVHASLVFLGLNGIEIEWDDDEVEELALNVASCQIEKDEVVAFFSQLLSND